MVYYHLRYNIYPAPGAPIEKEEWLELPERLDDQLMTKLLHAKHQTIVTLILSALICGEEYQLGMAKKTIDKTRVGVLKG